MPRPRVLLDTSILVSGIVFSNGNEHSILRLAENKRIFLVLPESVLIEANEVLREKFPGFEELLDVFLNQVGFESVQISEVLHRMAQDSSKVRDKKDTLLYAAAALSKPDYLVSGDGTLRQDLANSQEIINKTKVSSSREFLSDFRK